MKAKQGVVIGADALRQRLAGYGVIEHPTNGDAINVGAFDTKADNAAPSNMVETRGLLIRWLQH